jgi:hypothetical protein
MSAEELLELVIRAPMLRTKPKKRRKKPGKSVRNEEVA